MFGLKPMFLVVTLLWHRLQASRQDDRGMTTETMIITALLAAAALGAVGLIVNAIGNRAPDIADDIGSDG